MSWLARSLASTLMPDRQVDETEARKQAESTPHHPGSGEGGDPSRGVKEDLSELTQALTRQFRGVASFLAPPPTSSPSGGGGGDPAEDSDPPEAAGFRTEFSDIGGRFRSGISRLSNSKAVSEISKIASTFLPFGPGEGEDEEEWSKEGSERKHGAGAVGVTEEVMAFVRNISMHAETWLDFPLLPDDEESDGGDTAGGPSSGRLRRPEGPMAKGAGSGGDVWAIRGDEVARRRRGKD